MLYRIAVFTMGIGISLILGSIVYLVVGWPLGAVTRWALLQLDETQLLTVFVLMVAGLAFWQGWAMATERAEKRRANEERDER